MTRRRCESSREEIAEVDYEKGPDKKPEQMKMTADGRPDRVPASTPDDHCAPEGKWLQQAA